MVCASLPYLSGLANTVRLYADPRVGTAGVSATGRVLVSPQWFGNLDLADATFVMAHELLHLCLESHERGVGTDHMTFNIAHDYIINDILREELGRKPMEGALSFYGAKEMSAEKIVTMLRGGQLRVSGNAAPSMMRGALEDAGLLPPDDGDTGPVSGDVITIERESELFPNDDPADGQRRRQRVRAAAAKALSLAALKGRLDEIDNMPDAPLAPPRDLTAIANAMRAKYAPPWELALQQWMEAVAPGPRSYASASRRAAGHPEVVLAGRRRVGWTLNIILDTSGSMENEISRVLGLIAAFCESVSVGLIHILQCDQRVTVDEFIEPEELWSYQIEGFGGSDMGPAMLELAKDPEVEAVIIITDGQISYPTQPMPYEVLWAVTDPNIAATATPAYGRVIGVPQREDG
jgi:hypothetical protein